MKNRINNTLKNRLIVANLVFAAAAGTYTLVSSEQANANYSIDSSTANLSVVSLDRMNVVATAEEIATALNQTDSGLESGRKVGEVNGLSVTQLATIQVRPEADELSNLLPMVELAAIDVFPTQEEIAAADLESDAVVVSSTAESSESSTSFLRSAKANLPRINWEMPFYSFGHLLPRLPRN